MIIADPDGKLNGSGCRQVARTRSGSQDFPLPRRLPMRRIRTLIVVAGAAAVVAAGAGIATAAGGSDSQEGPDVAITGDALQKASEAALAETGGGRVTGSEVGDEESYYQVEVTRDDGSQVDVQLDRNFTVVGSKTDSAETDRENSGEGGN
jgi:hypothetical protein